MLKIIVNNSIKRNKLSGKILGYFFLEIDFHYIHAGSITSLREDFLLQGL